MNQLEQANQAAQEALEAWNRYIERALDGSGIIDPLERQTKLLAWAQAENKAGAIRRLAAKDQP